MPWTPDEFREKHAKDLTPKQAEKAAEIANAILRSGGDDGTAIATGIKHAKTQHRGGTR
jgi:uncharacterized protein YdaT